jgi:hypothetical protein
MQQRRLHILQLVYKKSVKTTCKRTNLLCSHWLLCWGNIHCHLSCSSLGYIGLWRALLPAQWPANAVDFRQVCVGFSTLSSPQLFPILHLTTTHKDPKSSLEFLWAFISLTNRVLESWGSFFRAQILKEAATFWNFSLCYTVFYPVPVLQRPATFASATGWW